jgi:hypothetical protein
MEERIGECPIVDPDCIDCEPVAAAPMCIEGRCVLVESDPT